MSTAARAAEPAEAGALWSGPYAGALLSYGRVAGEGAGGALLVGYGWRSGPWALGIEGDLTLGGFDGRAQGGRFETEALGGVRARVGYAFDRFVVYGAAGAAFASVEYARGGARDGATHFGWTLGAGAEAHLGGGVSARAEFLYVDLDRRGYRADREVSLAPDGGLARLGLNYRF
ncbi:membrane protein [Methylopila jiangsuensis]|uniref:Membrane protein n=1 Tax=Methylopila jiangsuensis TaxID=586230 RepID=A0A9W6JMH0_9HYPH|nr:outer membrane beta-barrel protein [Methylopila jiangsuensis]MDR6284427.1 outer membrane immunogenic protein [Methylopila jiangsuensis]GLK78188.1 membrane protein [Methylopila jiangsuensis]